MATPSLRGRLARFGNPRKPILKPKKPLVLANHVGERRREKGEATCITEMSVMMACWKQNEFRDEACRKEIQDFFDCASRAEVIESSWGILLGGEWGHTLPLPHTPLVEYRALAWFCRLRLFTVKKKLSA
ncbi:Coiled-coil-helix-coiled-coil-helix domain-containing protein 1 [Camelus dromedarius]|uniref:Coiled-coil-helix-coiled-coil-helix domain-containing protein 1 n=1 Tax=Camelus dromedarius TaxID=9838 RepID=A0A5N4DII1_CAMDR|nr:Coiled-coil-helix-coiled-coil-helix domain-containing protein 1 [Camelus dromedarius]